MAENEAYIDNSASRQKTELAYKTAHKKAVEALKRLTKHKQIILTQRGSKAIYAALYFIKSYGIKELILPDQGLWLSSRRDAKRLKLNISELKTKDGIISLPELKKLLKENNEKKALLYQNPAAYSFSQDIKAIYRLCSEHSCIVITDITSALIADFCNGSFSDIFVASFGKGKIPELCYGGFISFSNSISFSNNSSPSNSLSSNRNLSSNSNSSSNSSTNLNLGSLANLKLEFDKAKLNILAEKLKSSKILIEKHLELAGAVKKELSLQKFNVAHAEKKGLNVIVFYNTEYEKNAIAEFCNKKRYPFVLCPRYIRVLRNAVSIELKRVRLS